MAVSAFNAAITLAGRLGMPPYQAHLTSEKRIEERTRTRLRSGKLVTLDGRFITECHFHNIAGGGARIRVVGQCAIPIRFWLFDDQHRSALITEIVWRKDAELGVRFVDNAGVPYLSDAMLNALSGKYYSL